MNPNSWNSQATLPPDPQRLIERGQLALRAITSQAMAARVEARKTELEVALEEALRGDAGPLRHWLGANQVAEHPVVERQAPGVLDERSTPLALSPPALYPEESLGPAFLEDALQVRSASDAAGVLAAGVLAEKQSPCDVQSWDALLPRARARLHSVLQAPQTLEAQHGNQPELVEQAASEDAKPQLSLAEEEDCQADPLPEADTELVFEHLPALDALAEVDRDLIKSKSRGGARGFAVSMLSHLILLSVLMAITMRLPDVPLGLGFDSSPADEVGEALEISEPLATLEVTSPEVVPEMPSDAPASTLSLPSSNALSSASVNAAVPSASSVLSTIASATKSAASGSGSGTSSGRPNLSKASGSFFGAGAAGTSFCYVIDGSESMRGGPWESAKAELLRSLATLKENHRFYIVFFNQDLNVIPMPGERAPASKLLYATPENLRHAVNWIESLKIARGGPPADALECAVEIEPDAIYWLADGVTKMDVPKFLQEINRTRDFVSGEQVRVPIHTIAFYSPDTGRKLMQQVAAENKGQFIFVPDPRQK